uniref:Uncharacterized protein n=1 Tax=viral metagenome TaxID=1070528 RepID=A0A6C0KQH1_9ZZZZ
MKTGFLITGLIILLIANLLMVYSHRAGGIEGFAGYFLENAGSSGIGKYKLEPIGAFDDVRVTPNNGVSSWRGTAPNEPLLGPEFQPGPDSLFVFKNNQAKPGCCDSSYASDMGCVCTTPQQRNYINMRGGNRTVEDGV